MRLCKICPQPRYKWLRAREGPRVEAGEASSEPRIALRVLLHLRGLWILSSALLTGFVVCLSHADLKAFLMCSGFGPWLDLGVMSIFSSMWKFNSVIGSFQKHQ